MQETILNISRDISLSRNNNDSLKLSWLRLARTNNVGPKTFFNLLSLFGSSEEALNHLGDMAKAGGARGKFSALSITDAKTEMSRCEKFGAQLLFAFENHYPKELAAISDPPPVLTIKGDVTLLDRKKIAIVGARDCSLNGIGMSKELATTLAKSGYVIVSGLARGIDAVAHQACIETGTIGVIAGGIDNIYPKENRSIFEALYKTGLVVSEYPIGKNAMPQYFPQRNRIISGLSLGVIIIEAAKKSGTLITARLAAEQGREVFAVPGSPFDARSSGTNFLIRNGAILIESAEDVINELQSEVRYASLSDIPGHFYENSKRRIPSEAELAKHREDIIKLIPYNAIRIEDLIHCLEVEPEIVNFLILEMELAGRVARVYNNSVMRVA